MRRVANYAFVILACFVSLISTGCAKQAVVQDPSVRYVTLRAPYLGVPPGERNDRISVQYAVIDIARQAGYGYDWDRSFANTNPACRLFIQPGIKNKPFQKAMTMILKPAGLTYKIEDGKVVLFRRL